jgi:hypothetical protein
MKKTYLTTLLFSLLISPTLLNAQLIEYAIEDKGTFCYVLNNGTITTVSTPVRVGTFAFRHQVSTNQKRAEIDDCSWHAYDAKGNVYWYGASYYLPSASFGDDINSYVTQFRFSNIPEGSSSVQNCTTRACGQGGGESGSGHHLKVNNKQWEFTLRHQDPNCEPCRGSVTQKFFFGAIATNTWTDFVMQAKWSHNTDGFLKVWKQVNDGGYELVLDYQGRTWYDKYAEGSNRQGQDVKAPNYTVGLYYSNKTDTRTMFTDEIRVYRQETGVDGFSMVRPDQYNIECEEEAAPDAPADFSGIPTGTRQITLSWTDDGKAKTGYFIERKEAGTAFIFITQADKASTSYMDYDVMDGNTYTYQISSYNCFGTSSPTQSAEIQLEKDQTVSLEVHSATANITLGSYGPANAIDGKLNTYWLAEGKDQWLQLEFKDYAKISRINIGFIHGNNREYEFSIDTSMDGIDWSRLGDFKSSGTSALPEEYETETVDAKFVRFITGKSSVDEFTWLAEIEVRGIVTTSVENTANLQRDIFKIRQSQSDKRLEIHFNENVFPNSTVYVYNLAGQQVGADKTTQNPHYFNTSGFIPGIYLLKIQGMLNIAVQKVWIK